MAVFSILAHQKDHEHGGADCACNDLLENCLKRDVIPDGKIKNAFVKIAEKDPDARLCVDLCISLSLDTLSNQIIRYRDVNKLSKRPLILPYFLYEKKCGLERGMLLVEEAPASYLYAKGMYYCMSEQGALLAEAKNEIIVMDGSDPDGVCDVWKKMAELHPGAFQRKMDSLHFKDYAQLKKKALEEGERLMEQAPVRLSEEENRSGLVEDYVIRWFLLKKVLYVQYMVNKDILMNVHHGSIKRQRCAAKENADEITFLPLCQMYRMPKKESSETKKEK